jgi:hypothetical protein
LESNSIEYVVKGDIVGITNSIKISDSDDITIESATISLSSNFQVGEDWLTYTAQDGITYNWNEKTGVLSLQGKLNFPNMKMHKKYSTQILFLNTTKTDRTITITINDEFDGSKFIKQLINIKKTNDAPILSGMEADSIKFVKGSNAISISQKYSC